MERDYYNEGWIDGYKRGADDERPKAFSDGYEKGYQKWKSDAIVEALEPYDAESIEDLAYNAYRKGGKDAIKRMLRRMNTIWGKYEQDPENVPKPDFMSAVALIAMMEGEKNE